jgi:uncharacterized protein (TIGR03492 family)
MTGAPRLLSVSNGHGEDDIACKVIDALRPRVPGLVVEAWPMVGTGSAYRARGIPVGGPANLLPSEGFGTLGLRAFLRDLRAGLLSTYGRQALHARRLRGRHDLLLGVGDAVPLAVAALSGVPMAFVACAKSAYSGGKDGHLALERHLMRRHCVEVFARDALTARGLAARGVPCAWVGNPMMDGLGDPDAAWPVAAEETAVLMLPGSRRDAGANARFLLGAAALMSGDGSAPGRLRFLFALHPALPPAALADAAGWQPVPATGAPPGTLRLVHPGGATADIATGTFGAMARAARIAVGLAGTANEQAIGMGLPLITLPGAGNQGEAFVRMKMAYFGPAAEAVPRDAAAVAAAIRALLTDPQRQARMSAAGRERMGPPGASAAIAARLAARLARRDGGSP